RFDGSPAPPDAAALVAFLQGDRGLETAWARCRADGELPLQRVFCAPDTMSPRPGPPSSWDVPALATAGALAGWLGITPRELNWFADCGGRQRRAPPGPLRHYTYRWVARAGGRARLLE